jgi:hypothetical protein
MSSAHGVKSRMHSLGDKRVYRFYCSVACMEQDSIGKSRDSVAESNTTRL